MIRAAHARLILMGLSGAAEAGPVFYAINKCIAELDTIATAEMTESFRDRPLENMEMSVRLDMALRVRCIKTVRELESMTAAELTKSKSYRPPLGKKSLREVRELLASMGMKLKGDP
jgi:DNA-directed RNA polymerase alpha subunit